MRNDSAIEGLVALRRKYQRMLEMRRINDSGVDHDPRAEMRLLASQFPGALREIDELPIALVETRIRALDLAIVDESAREPWMSWMVDYHGHLRAALRIKRMGLRLADLDAALIQLHREYAPAFDEPPVETFSVREALAAVLKPSGGRLNEWVFARLAKRHRVTVDEVQSALFPARRSHR